MFTGAEIRAEITTLTRCSLPALSIPGHTCGAALQGGVKAARLPASSEQHRMARDGMAQHKVMWHSTAWHGTAWYGTPWHGMMWLARHGTAWPSTTRRTPGMLTRAVSAQLSPNSPQISPESQLHRGEHCHHPLWLPLVANPNAHAGDMPRRTHTLDLLHVLPCLHNSHSSGKPPPLFRDSSGDVLREPTLPQRAKSQREA